MVMVKVLSQDGYHIQAGSTQCIRMDRNVRILPAPQDEQVNTHGAPYSLDLDTPAYDDGSRAASSLSAHFVCRGLYAVVV